MIWAQIVIGGFGLLVLAAGLMLINAIAAQEKALKDKIKADKYLRDQQTLVVTTKRFDKYKRSRRQ